MTSHLHPTRNSKSETSRENIKPSLKPSLKPEFKKWWVYMILSKNGKIYTGVTINLERRFQEHLSSQKGAKFFRGNPPVKILWKKEYKSRSTAQKEETRIKSLSRKGKELIINH